MTVGRTPCIRQITPFFVLNPLSNDTEYGMPHFRRSTLLASNKFKHKKYKTVD